MDVYSLNPGKQVLFRYYDADNDYFRINNLLKFSKDFHDVIFLSNDQASEFVAEFRKQELIGWQKYEGRTLGRRVLIEKKSPADTGSLVTNETVTKNIKKINRTT